MVSFLYKKYIGIIILLRLVIPSNFLNLNFLNITMLALEFCHCIAPCKYQTCHQQLEECEQVRCYAPVNI